MKYKNLSLNNIKVLRQIDLDLKSEEKIVKEAKDNQELEEWLLKQYNYAKECVRLMEFDLEGTDVMKATQTFSRLFEEDLNPKNLYIEHSKWEYSEKVMRAICNSLTHLFRNDPWLIVSPNKRTKVFTNELVERIIKKARDRHGWETDNRRKRKTIRERFYEFKDKGYKVNSIKQIKENTTESDVKLRLYKQHRASEDEHLIPEGFVEITFEDMMTKLYGITDVDIRRKPGYYKNKADLSDEELVRIGFLKGFFTKVRLESNYNTSGRLFVDTNSYTVPDDVDSWAFSGSCHNSESNSGPDTHLYHRAIGGEYLRIYVLYKSDKVSTLLPYGRIYFLRNGEHILHAGMYSKQGYPDLHVATYTLSYIFGKDPRDFVYTLGIKRKRSGEYSCGAEHYYYNFWHNMFRENDYKVMTTKKGIWDNFYIEGEELDFLPRHYFESSLSDTIKLEEK